MELASKRTTLWIASAAAGSIGLVLAAAMGLFGGNQMPVEGKVSCLLGQQMLGEVTNTRTDSV